MRTCLTIKISFVIVLILSPFSLFADWKDFIPVPYDNWADLRVFASYERDDFRVNTNRLIWDDSFLREKFTLYSRGYFYHPRFLQYYFSLGGALKQERFSSTTFGDIGWQSDSGYEYNARFYLLPEHPYNLELFSQRLEPLIREQNALRRNNVETSNGVLFRYEDKPYAFNARYISNSISTNTVSTDTDTFGVGGSYFKDFGNAKIFSVSGNYVHPEFSNSQGLEGDSDDLYASNYISNGWLSLNSGVSKTNFNQSGTPSGDLESDLFSWLERFTALLPYRFRSDVQYRYQKNENRIERFNILEDERTSTIKSLQVNVSHRLYESLDSQYIFRRDVTESFAGESKSKLHYGDVHYVNETDLGRLTAGASVGRTETESTGIAEIVNEPHSGVSVPGFFILNEKELVDPQTIEIFLKSPLPPNELILLSENIHYTVTPDGSTFRINILALPPQFVIPETYDFFATYSLLTGSFVLQTDTYGYNVGFDFFYMLEPFYSYSNSSPEVLEGAFPGPLFDSTLQTAGLLFHKGGFRLLGEYQEFDWEISPYHHYRIEARYSGSLSSTVRLQTAAEYLNRYYPEGTSAVGDDPYREERTTASANLQKHFLRRRLSFSVGGSYAHFDGLTEGNAYSFNSALSWTIAKLDFTLGGTALHSDTDGITTLSQERTHQYYYLNMGRRF